MLKSLSAQNQRTALILSGGGARAAYQVGVLKAIGDMIPRGASNPFPIICGTSAGAINATAVATHASRFRQGIRGLEAVWHNFEAGHVYRTDVPGLFGRAFQWLSAIFFGGIGNAHPVSLLDNRPLRQMLARTMRFERVQESIEEGYLRALSITASGYTTGESVCFFQGAADIHNWRRARRIGIRTELGLDHLMASSAIPAVFPAVKINREYFGDGSVRQLAPISPALHMGADKVLVIGVSGNLSAKHTRRKVDSYPSVAQIAGHMLNSVFLDSLEADLERLERVNRTVRLIDPDKREAAGVPLREVEVLKISPSAEIDVLAARFASELPRSIRFFLRGSGATESAGSTLVSYLLFERGFCRELIRLGYHDAMRREREILRFLGLDPFDVHAEAGLSEPDTW